MKRKLGTMMNILLITMIISTYFISLNAGINQNQSNPEVINPIRNLKQLNLEYFDISDFTNSSHSINVSRIIIANEYGYTTSYTEIHLFNNGTKPINAFNYTIPLSEFENSRYFRIYSFNDTKTDYVEVVNSETTNISVIKTIKIPQVDVEESVTIIISSDHPGAVSFESSALLQQSTFPYSFNLSFIPLITLPITSFDLEWKIGPDIEVTFDSESITPAEDDIIGKMNPDDFSLMYENVESLKSVNRTLLNTTEYGEYNLTALEDKNFIPAYSTNLQNNLTTFLAFDYYHVANIKIEFKSLKTTVTVEEWGFIKFEHEFTVKNLGLKSGPVLSSNLGGPTFPKLTVHVSENAQHIGLKDQYGNLTTTNINDPILGKKIVEIKPRIDIEPGREYNLYLTYKEKSSNLAKDLGTGKVQLKIPMTLDFNWTVQNFEFRILLPHGSTYNQNDIASTMEEITLRNYVDISVINGKQLIRIFDRTGIQITFEDLTPLSNRIMEITFGLDPLYLLKQPVSISLVFLILGLAYIVLRNASFGLGTRKVSLEEIPLDLIKEFVKWYEEKTAIREQVLRLDKKRKSKNISAREYEQTKIILKNRQQQADRKIVSVSKRLGDEGQRYRVAMRSIEVAEANREDILLNIESVERKKTQGRIGKEAYAKLKLSYDKQLRKANNEVDKVLIELRSLLTK
ncbi:MAG: hypothetical protein EAX86_08780 [Candidatus Heimdallarchaeota archaeon]|nr:hypothetical protein [Candidatus Heimdallarchaeota archaeon]